MKVRTLRQEESNKGEDAADDHGKKAHPTPAPPVEEEREYNGSGQFCYRGQRERGENVGVQQLHVPHMSIEHQDY